MEGAKNGDLLSGRENMSSLRDWWFVIRSVAPDSRPGLRAWRRCATQNNSRLRWLKFSESVCLTLEKLGSNDDRAAEDCPEGEIADNPLTI